LGGGLGGGLGGLEAGLEVPIENGVVSPLLREEFAGLALRYSVVDAKPGRSPAGVKERLRYLANRLHGQRALSLRREPIASAYRVFFRQIGLDPDEFRTPIEATVLERLRVGGFRSHGIVEDALTIAIVETGVAMRALDASRLSGRLRLRVAGQGERFGGKGLELEDGTIVLADEQYPIALIFGETAPDYEVQKDTGRIAVCAIQVNGVPDISVEEAIWSCVGALQSKAKRS
jgi:DNA/RNA-binding domain of Phe-tRNA-synthetase-like protein